VELFCNYILKLPLTLIEYIYIYSASNINIVHQATFCLSFPSDFAHSLPQDSLFLESTKLFITFLSVTLYTVNRFIGSVHRKLCCECLSFLNSCFFRTFLRRLEMTFVYTDYWLLRMCSGPSEMPFKKWLYCVVPSSGVWRPSIISFVLIVRSQNVSWFYTTTRIPFNVI